MNDSQPNDGSSREASQQGGAGSVPADPGAESELTKPKALTPEEQMALYEEDLKETDWGHQPC